MKASVCVPTYRRAASLERAVRALFALQPPEGGFEIVVVDDGSPPEDRKADLLARLAAESPVPFTWRVQATNRGPGAARNVAWRAASGEWVAFTDDDCEVDRRWLVSLLAATDSACAPSVVQGLTRPDPARSHLLSHPFARSMRVDGPNRYYQTCNIAYRRDLLGALDGFDESFRLIGDDTDLGWRAVEGGASVAFAPDAVVTHEVAVGDFGSDLRSRRRWVDTLHVIAKHPDARSLAWRRYIFRPNHLPVLVLAALSPLALHRVGRRLLLTGCLAGGLAAVARAGSPERAFARLGKRVGDGYEVALLARASVKERILLL